MNRSLTILFTLLALTFSTLGVTPAYAATFIVTNTNNSGAGSLRQAIADAPSGSTITFNPSLSGATIRLGSELTISKNVIIDGSALASKIILSGDTDGNGSGNVGVVYINFGAIVTLDSLIITKGNAAIGGGIRCHGTLTITNSIVTDNFALYEGAGIATDGSGEQLTITNSTISGNRSGTGGGGIFSYNGTLTIINSTISGNSAAGDETNEGGGSGGAIFNQHNSLIIINSTISGNSAENNGGAIFNFQDGTSNVYNSTIVYNGANSDADAEGLAGGVYVMNGGTFNIRNTILAGNSVSGAPIYDDCHGFVNSYGLNLIGALSLTTSGSCTKNGSWNQLNDLNLLGILQNNGGPTKTVALLAGSNAIDGADSFSGCVNSSGVVLPTDQRGYGRAGVRCDVGAFEFNGNLPPAVLSITRASANPTNAASVDFTITFSESVTGVDTSDFNLTTSGVSGVTFSLIGGSGSSYTGRVNTGSGNGTIRLNVVNDGSIKDVGLTPLAAGFTGGETYTIIKNPTFADVPFVYWAWGYIERLYGASVTGGCSASPLNYCPDSTVTRAQMAVFLLKGMHGSGFTPPAINGVTGFSDVATDHWAAAWIKQLAAEGITSGCGAGVYCPEATVTRAQMAVFLLKAKHGSSYIPPNATGVFNDVPVGYWADKWIERLAAEGVTSGCGAGIYCPDAEVTRAQMAVFLVKTFNLP